jgi:uncharacterized membrane protein YidH (DUF202 family)
MKTRHWYLVAFGLPAALAAGGVALALFAAAAGLAWIFVAGDKPWPGYLEVLLVVVFAVVFLVVWGGLLRWAYAAGIRRESRGGIDPRHLLVSAGVTALLLALVALQQWSVGNIGPQSDGLRCSDYCRAKGFGGSSTPPRDTGSASCSCLDANGREALTVPMTEVDARPAR